MVSPHLTAVRAAGAIPELQATSRRLQVGIVQMALGKTIADNRDRIVAGITNAAARAVRVAVFPESALSGTDGDRSEVLEEAVSAIEKAARNAKLFVVFGGCTYSTTLKRNSNWMRVIDPDGREVFRYEKLYDNHRAPMPGVFHIDGIPCSAMICADRWLRGVEEVPIQEGAQISFELSCNFASEWVAPLGWYWYVPRALRNNVWVVFANTGNRVSGVPDDPGVPRELRHGHSAIISPNGRIAAAAGDDAETIVMANLEISEATRATALARAAHPAMRRFWQAGVKLRCGEAEHAPSLALPRSQPIVITLAAAQVTNDLAAMESLIEQARSTNVDLVAFPALAIPEAALERLRAAAKQHCLTVVVGAEYHIADERRNSAFVIGPDGCLLTRYDQLSATSPFRPGTNPAAMWFRVKGVPAVVTVGEDALWTELAELAAVAGAQIHVHLDHNASNDSDVTLRRLQIGSNLASFRTFSVTANVVGSAIWEDLQDSEERRAEVRGLPRPNTGTAEIYSPFSANLVVRAGVGPQLITASRRLGPQNQYHPARTSSFNPQMDAWYRLGAAIIHPDRQDTP